MASTSQPVSFRLILGLLRRLRATPVLLCDEEEAHEDDVDPYLTAIFFFLLWGFDGGGFRSSAIEFVGHSVDTQAVDWGSCSDEGEGGEGVSMKDLETHMHTKLIIFCI